MAKQNNKNPYCIPSAAAALNHLCHGATSTSLFLPDENPAEFFAILESSFEQHQPTTNQDASLVADSVLARWFLLRNQRSYSTYQFKLYRQKPEPEMWDLADLHKLELFDRYRTRAERALGRALNNVRQIHKDAQSETRWQAQHALQRERFELALQRETRLAAAKARRLEEQEPELPLDDLIDTSKIPLHHQTLFIGLEDDDNPATSAAKIFEIRPPNHTLEAVLQKTDTITRTYKFLGGVPASYQHLVEAEAPNGGPIKWAMSTSITKIHTYDEWKALTTCE